MENKNEKACCENKKENSVKVKVFYCLPMSGRTDEDILNQINDECLKIIELVKTISVDAEIEMLCNYQKSDNNIDFSSDIKHENMYFLGRGIKSHMSRADIVVFGKGWENSRGCKVEHYICETYGMKHFYI